MRIKLGGLELKDIEHLPILKEARPSISAKVAERAEIGLFQCTGGIPNPEVVLDKTIYVAGRTRYPDNRWIIISANHMDREMGTISCNYHLPLNFVGSYEVTKIYKPHKRKTPR